MHVPTLQVLKADGSIASDEQSAARVRLDRCRCDTRVPSVSDRGVRFCDLHEHRAQSEDHGRRPVLHAHGRHQRLRRGHGHFHLSCKKFYLILI